MAKIVTKGELLFLDGQLVGIRLTSSGQYEDDEFCMSFGRMRLIEEADIVILDDRIVFIGRSVSYKITQDQAEDLAILLLEENGPIVDYQGGGIVSGYILMLQSAAEQETESVELERIT